MMAVLRWKFAALLLLVTASPMLSASNVQLYDIDGSSSNASAKVAFFGISSKTARFPKISGSAKIDPTALSSLSLKVDIDARALQASDGVTLRRLKGEKFFHVAKYPNISFTGSRLKLTGPKTGSISGKMTAKGVTRPVTLAISFARPIANAGTNKPISITAKTTINRRDFGMTAYSAIVGNKVKITVNAKMTPR